MSVTHRLRAIAETHPDEFGRHYPRLTIVAEGIDDVYRLARHLEIGQVEFSEIGRRTLVGLDRRWPGIVRRLVARMGPGRVAEGRGGYPGIRPRPKPATRGPVS